MRLEVIDGQAHLLAVQNIHQNTEDQLIIKRIGMIKVIVAFEGLLSVVLFKLTVKAFL